MPTRRTTFTPGELLTLKVIVLSEQPPREATLYWRRMGKGAFRPLPLQHKARGVYHVEFPSVATTGDDLEYYIRIEPQGAGAVCFPVTSPALNQTLVAVNPGEERLTKARGR